MPNIRKPIFVMPIDLGSIVTANARDANPVINLNRHKAPGLTWRSAGASNVWARGFIGSVEAISFCAMIAANALPGTKIRLRLGTSQADVDGTSAPYDSGVLDFISPAVTRDSGLYHSHLELGSTVNASWWRIDISGHTGDFEASSLVLGAAISPSRFYNLDYEYGIKDLGQIDISNWGVFDETDGLIWRTVTFTLAWQTEDEFEASFRPLIERVGQRGIVYCCFDPEPSTYRQSRTYMGIFGKTPFARGVKKPRTFTQDFQIISFI